MVIRLARGAQILKHSNTKFIIKNIRTLRGLRALRGENIFRHGQCFAYELNRAKIPFQLQVSLPVDYKQIRLDCGYRIDLFVDNSLIVEVKSIDQLLIIHEAQILTYMKLAKVNVGLLINFNVEMLKKGVKRFVF